LICNFLSIQFDEDDNEKNDNSIIDGASTNRTLTPKAGKTQNKSSLTDKNEMINNLLNKNNVCQSDMDNNQRILYEKRLNSLENFASILEVPKFFCDLLKQFTSDKKIFENLKEVNKFKCYFKCLRV
jgi:hypothetical protein